jgi:AraC-like DNA-binding protein
VLDLVRALGALGLDPETLCDAAGIAPDGLAREDVRVPSSRVTSLLAAAERASGDRLVGLHAAQHSTPRGPLLYLMLAAADVEAGMRYWERFGPLTISSLRVRVDSARGTAGMTFDLGDEGLDASRHVAEYMLLSVLRPLKQAAAGELRPREVCFRHAPHGDVGAVEAAFGCPVRFERPAHALVFRRRDLAMPSRLANPVIAQQIATMTAALGSRAAVRASWRERVGEVTRAMLVTGQRADRASVARQLHVSEPSLHRALREERTTFKAVRDAEVWSVAGALLAGTDVKIEAVARSVGFADGASFAKAFKRHSGISPHGFRTRADGGARGR